MMERKISREQLEQGRHRCNPYRICGYKASYCEQMGTCEVCNTGLRLGCRIIRKIEDIQTKRILKICKKGVGK